MAQGERKGHSGPRSIPRVDGLCDDVLAASRGDNVAKIYELWDEYVSALAAGDVEAWMSLWTHGGVELSAAGRLLAGAERIRAAYRPVMDLFDTQMAVSPEHVRILGDSAYSYGSYKQLVTPKEGGESIGYCGRFLTISRSKLADHGESQ